MLSISMLNQIRKENRDTYRSISERSGVPVSTVQKVLGGITENPRRETLLAIEKALCDGRYRYKDESAQTGYKLNDENAETSAVSEPELVYGTTVLAYPKKRDGEYTVEDYYALPDDYRVELIDGVFYDMAAPSNPHQVVAGALYAQLFNFIRANGGDCVPMISPADVQLDCDDKTMVQPDVFVVCERDKLRKKNTFGAPDLVMEVLSRSTKYHDMSRKCLKYHSSGVREYWIIDLDKKLIIVHDFMKDETSLYGVEERAIPVRIYEGRCTIDFSDIWEYIQFML